MGKGHVRSKPPGEGPDPGPFLMNPLIHKLSNHTDLPQADRTVLEDLARKPEHIVAHTDLIREGAVPDRVYLILTGWACRYKVLPDGQRQIMAYFIPGDLIPSPDEDDSSQFQCTGDVIQHGK